MNQAWSALNKELQMQLKKRETYQEGLQTLFSLRRALMQVFLSFRDDLTDADFSAMPFPNANGYHSKTIAYSLWHILRIEDIVAHTLMMGDAQIFFSGGYQARMHAPVITTGNELTGHEIADFSAQLDLDALYAYIAAVQESTERFLTGMPYEMLKQRITAEKKAALQSLNVVSAHENAAWLIDYWCGKNYLGLIQMPFSRHWIMHTEASLRIKNKLK